MNSGVAAPFLAEAGFGMAGALGLSEASLGSIGPCLPETLPY